MHEEFECLDCGVNTLYIGEYYMLLDELWLEVLPTQSGMLCLSCVETRLDRRLEQHDFSDCPLNRGSGFHQSNRLKDRTTNRLCHQLPERG